MPYIGNDIQFGELTSQSFTGDGSTTAFTLSYTVANPTSLIVTIADVIQEPTTAYTVAGTTLTCTSAPADGDTIHVRFLGRVVDVANAAILQDSDQDTKIQVEESADEDTIRFDVAGAEVATLTNSALILKGTTPTLTIGDAGAEDAKIVFDGNAQDYHIGLDDTDDDLVIGVGSALGTTTAVSVDENAKVKVDVGMLGPLYIGDTANANNTGGLTINQLALDDEILALKSSDIAHGYTSGSETDTYGHFKKVSSTLGGLLMTALREDSGGNEGTLQMHIHGPQTMTTTKTTVNWNAAWQVFVKNHDGANSAVDATANGNVFSLNVFKASAAKFIFGIDEDGDIYQDGTSGNAFDAWDDAALLRGIELWRSQEHPDKGQILPSRFDANAYTKEHLNLTKVMNIVPDDEWNEGARSTINLTETSRIVSGAVWQNHEMLDAIIETMEERDAGFTAALKKKFVARGLPTQILDWTGDIPDDLVKPDVAPKAFNAE